jgi:hypothetical protein
VGRDEQMSLSVGLINSEVSWNQPRELTEQVSSKKNLDQQMQLTEEEDQDDLLMIGGIGVFLPCAQEEAKICVADGATAEQSPLTMTGKEEEELEQNLEASQADEEEDEHSEEWIDIFSDVAEETTTWEFAAKEEKVPDNICFVDLWGQIEALEERVKVQGMHIQQVKLETNEGGMGDHEEGRHIGPSTYQSS